MRPMIDRERDLKGATPELLAKALMNALPGQRRKPIVPDEVPVGEPVTDKSADRKPHLDKRS